MNASELTARNDLPISATVHLERADNYQENGKWVGAFKTDDRVRTPGGRVGTVTTCFGYCEFGYAYIVTYSPDCCAHLSEWQLELAPAE